MWQLSQEERAKTLSELVSVVTADGFSISEERLLALQVRLTLTQTFFHLYFQGNDVQQSTLLCHKR